MSLPLQIVSRRIRLISKIGPFDEGQSDEDKVMSMVRQILPILAQAGSENQLAKKALKIAKKLLD